MADIGFKVIRTARIRDDSIIYSITVYLHDKKVYGLAKFDKEPELDLERLLKNIYSIMLGEEVRHV